MKLRNLATALRHEPLPELIGEAGWRLVRPIRRSIFRHAPQSDVCPVRFQPIGYEPLQTATRQTREAIVTYADAVLRGEYPLMGYGSPRLGTAPDWQCDWVSGKSWPLDASKKLRLVRHDGSDVKAPWELSRLQFAPVVAKAYALTGDDSYRHRILSLLTDWLTHNPVGRGVNWTTAMEVALRGISLCLTMELLWPFAAGEQQWLDRMTARLWQHLRFIEAHSEFSFRVRSNHYLGNIVGLTTLSAYLHGPGMNRRRRNYARAVQQEILKQTYADGGDCEASTGYHLLVAQLGLHSYRVQQRSNWVVAPEFEDRLRRMFDWIAVLSDEDGKLPHLGDCDNGRVELLPDDLAQAQLPPSLRHSLQTRALCTLASHVLRPPVGSVRPEPGRQPVCLLPQSGLAVLRSGEASVVFCAMPNGLAGKGSHTHCDKLSIVFRLGVDEVFSDPGSRCYTRSAEFRNLDRATKAHNTLMIDEADQNIVSSDPELLFQCGNQAAVSPIAMVEGEERAVRASHRGYSRIGIEHQRTVRLGERSLVLIDEVMGPGIHSLDLRFVLGPGWTASSEMMTGTSVSCVIGGPRQLILVCESESELTLSVLPAEISREYGTALPVSSIRVHSMACLPARVRTQVSWIRDVGLIA